MKMRKINTLRVSVATFEGGGDSRNGEIQSISRDSMNNYCKDL